MLILRGSRQRHKAECDDPTWRNSSNRKNDMPMWPPWLPMLTQFTEEVSNVAGFPTDADVLAYALASLPWD